MKSSKQCVIRYDISITIPHPIPFDDIEIHPVLAYKDGNKICFEECSPDLAENWSVYLQRKGGGLICIADCKDAQTAMNLVQLIRIIVEHWKVRN